MDTNKKINSKEMNIAKAIVIILMVMGHAKSPFTKYLYLFHLATFIFISGYFYNEKYDNNFILLLKKRLKSLYFPYVKYVFIFTILNNLFYKLKLIENYLEFNKETIIKLIKGLITFNAPIDTLGAFWFLKTLFLCNIAFGFISFIIKKMNFNDFEYIRLTIIGVLFLSGNTILNIYGPISMQNIIKVLMCMPIFYCGVMFKKYRKYIRSNGYIIFSLIILLYISAQQGGIDIVSNIYTNAVFFLVNSLIGAYVVIYLSRSLVNLDKYNILDYIGKNTLPILAGHWLCFEIVDICFNVNSSNVRWILYTTSGVVIPLLIYFIIVKFIYKIKDYISFKFRTIETI